MKVIFLDSNEVKDVAPGYARNYLFPRGLAVLATKGNLRKIELHRALEEKRKEVRIRKAAAKKKKLESKVFEIKARVGKEGKLHGSVTRAKIAEVIGVEKEAVLLENPIKALGEYEVEIKVDSQKAKIRLRVSGEGRVSKEAEASKVSKGEKVSKVSKRAKGKPPRRTDSGQTTDRRRC